MIDETASSDRDERTRQRLSVLYDPETGRAVAGHTFVGVDDELSGPEGAEARERVLREEARDRGDLGRLRFLEAPQGLRLDGPVELRVEGERLTSRPLRIVRRNVDAATLRVRPRD
ncbi:hypothetical protein ACGGZK_10420 [Agromyces sp. MMS24-K17]|uniref:hypothetical protein n=1 Tax=Agromyces sp. MMS24-K17 TaxID=3372850 RepID=UPI00375468DD